MDASDPQRCAVLYPAIAEAARRVAATAVGLIDLGRGGGANLTVDRVAITYSNGQTLGNASSAVQLFCTVVGDRAIPNGAMPAVVARLGIGRARSEGPDADDAHWLRACVAPDQLERPASVEACLALAAATAPRLLPGDPVEVLPDAIGRVPGDALPVLTTTWALSRFAPERRVRFVHRLAEAAAGRTVAWVSVEGVGVAPAIPTLGDRPAFGHSTVGLTIWDGSTMRSEAIGRCWSQGRWLAWLTGDEACSSDD